MFEFTVRQLSRQGVEEVRQLHPMTHDPIEEFHSEVLPDGETVVGVENPLDGIRRAEKSLIEFFDHAQDQPREEL
ncbi:MAG TPA: hypothetical protein VFF52_27920 [Isosphaeraceae bacterium]|nr:hypothetical protein [Isosphaeraceae bacterium]